MIVVSLAILGMGVKNGEIYPQHKVWTKALVLLDD